VNSHPNALALFDQCLLLDPADWSAWLDRACSGDAHLRFEVEQLLEADRRANDFLGTPLAQETSDRSGERIGPWRLDALVGIGGMGSVYRAVRADDAYERTVAIKFLLFDAGDLRRRFTLEQHILGTLTHPHIAALFDVGKDSHGAPYLVMEYIDGVPITDYAQAQALDVRARVALFKKVLDAVQTAHAQLIIHRDIKPGNVLVTNGTPKLLDFGIAKLIGDAAVAAHTRTGFGPLTPEYASPEQVRGEPIGVASDIYSLGMLLYELVTCERPYAIDYTSPSTIERTVCLTDPPAPSAQFKLRVGNARDLDALILKALEKQPAQRYSSCAEFAAELQRWLDGDAVIARMPTQRERILRWLRRHRLGASVGAAIALTFLAGFAATFWEAVVAREQANLARAERDRAQSVVRFLTDTLSAASPENLGREVTVLEVLKRASADSRRALAAHADIAATVQLALADTFLAVGDMPSARDCGEQALAFAQRDNDSGLIIDSEISLGYTLRQNGDLVRAQELFDSARAHATAHGSAQQRAMSAQMLGAVAQTRGAGASAQRWYRVALSEEPSNETGARADILNSLAIATSSDGDVQGAVALHRQALDLLRGAQDQDSPRLAKTLADLGTAQDRVGDAGGASASFKEALQMLVAMDGESHPDVVNTLSSMTMFYVDHGDVPQALTYGARAVADSAALPKTNLQFPYAQYSYARALLLARRPQEAVPPLTIALAARSAIYPQQHPQTLITQSWLGLARAETGEVAAGKTLASDAYAGLHDKLGEDHDMTQRARSNLLQIDALAKLHP
jgi:serine/threonine-protein kinase